MGLMSSLRYVPVELLALAVLLGLGAAAVAAAPAVRRRDHRAATSAAARVLLGGAVLAVLAVTLVSGTGGADTNLIPGAGIRSALDNVNRELGLVNVFGNIVMFVPIGVLIPLATPLRYLQGVAACVVLSVAVELMQLATGRSSDVDDVLLNTLGAAVGAAFGAALAGLLRRRQVSR